MPCLLSLTSPAEGSDPSSVVQLDPPPAVGYLGRVREYHRSIVGRLGLGPQPWARPRLVGQALEGTPAARTLRTEAGGPGRHFTLGERSARVAGRLRISWRGFRSLRRGWFTLPVAPAQRPPQRAAAPTASACR